MPEPTAIQVRVALAEYMRHNLRRRSLPIPDYATDLNACAKVEAKLERDGDGMQYAFRVNFALTGDADTRAAAWSLLHCPPATRARAAYDVLQQRDAKGGAKP